MTLLADATIENTALLRRLRVDERAVARGAALTERLAKHLLTDGVTSRGEQSKAPVDFREVFEAVTQQVLPPWHEQGVVATGQRSFDLFFTTAAIENRSDGARPQRIRAMSQAFESDEVPLVRVTANENMLKRRIAAMTELVRDGATPRWGYGENSTSPMPEVSLKTLANALSLLRGAGLRFGWFVRDLHWLDPDSTVSTMPLDIRVMRERGVAEFEAMRAVSDVLFAPTLSSAEWFDVLLRRHGVDTPAEWHALPPGVDLSNVLAPPAARADEPIELLYAGGIGGVYDLTTIVDSLRDVAEPWILRMTVRREDLEAAAELTMRLPGERVRVTTGELTDQPQSGSPVMGLALLDTKYGRASFPVKVMNYFERCVPVLVYAESPVADQVRQYRAGVAVESSPAAVTRSLTMWNARNPRIDWDTVHSEQSWVARAAWVRTVLEQTVKSSSAVR